MSSSTTPSQSAVAVGSERLLAGGLGFLEAPRWRGGRVWFSDFHSRWVCSVGAGGDVERHYYVAGQPSGLGPCVDGSLLIASMYDGRLIRGGADGSVRTVADVGAFYRAPLGDVAVDGRGRAYVSTLPDLGNHDPTSTPRCPIYLVDPTGSVTLAAEGLQIPNGMAVTANGSALLVAETRACRLLRLPVAHDGTLGMAEVFADLGHRRPDGICLDRSGAVWVASPFTSEFILVAAGGDVLATIDTPGSWAVACALSEDAATLCGLTAEVTTDDFRIGAGVGAVRLYPIERR